MDKFSSRLKEEREKLKAKDPKWTQEYVADKLGVARTTYTAYENGTKQPPLDTVARIADIFNVSTDYLSGRSKSRNPENPDKGEMYFWDKENVSEEEMKEALAFIQARRMMKKQQDNGDK